MNENTHRLVLQEAPAPEELIPDFGLWPWWLAAGVLALAIITVLVFLKTRKPAAAVSATLREIAFREALAALDESAANDSRSAAVQSSLALRRYLSVTAADPALFETHEEFISRHDALRVLTADARTAAESCFSRLAALKYAPEIPDMPAADVFTESRALLETLHHGFAA
ncbi:MAG: hypothetical protein Q8Q59_13740 [Luteolibacter sp.]|jgi:hypothetical protein|nr:hypothetical protein [Luteolibacter sp.]